MIRSSVIKINNNKLNSREWFLIRKANNTIVTFKFKNVYLLQRINSYFCRYFLINSKSTRLNYEDGRLVWVLSFFSCRRARKQKVRSIKTNLVYSFNYLAIWIFQNICYNTELERTEETDNTICVFIRFLTLQNTNRDDKTTDDIKNCLKVIYAEKC